MDSAIYTCPDIWRKLLPPNVRRLTIQEELNKQPWCILALTQTDTIKQQGICCETLLIPGACCTDIFQCIRTERVISYGLSSRDSLTLSSLRTPVLCVQRTLVRPDGRRIEPQEFLLHGLPLPAEDILPLLGLRLLLDPLESV